MANTATSNPANIKRNRIRWIVLALLVLGIVGIAATFFRGGRDAAPAPSAPVTSTSDSAKAPAPPGAPSLAPPETQAQSDVSALRAFFESSAPVPHSFVFATLRFGAGSSQLRAVDLAEMGRVAAVLQQYGTARLRIAGQTDQGSSDVADIELGKARADAIAEALVARGIDGARIETVSLGEQNPIDAEPAASRSRKRRAELIIIAR